MMCGTDERQEAVLKSGMVREIEARATDLKNELVGGGMYMARRLYHIEQKTEQLVFTIRCYLKLSKQMEAPVEVDVDALLNPLREGLAEVTD
jgi:hypothetical protein